MIGTTRVASAFILGCLLSSVALAESKGTITGTINGEAVTWQLRAGQSDWNEYGLSVMGSHPEGSEEFPSIMIGFEKNGESMERPELRLLSQAANYAGDAGEGVSVRVVKWNTDGETLMVAGSIAGPAYLVTNAVGPVIDTSDARDLDLTFDLTITNP